MNKPNHACVARQMPFPTHGGEYTSRGTDLMRVEPLPEAAPAPAAETAAEPATPETESAARRGKKRED